MIIKNSKCSRMIDSACSLDFSFSKRAADCPISTRALVVPLRALKTTIFFSGSAVMSFATSCIRSGFPTEVPPNFITFIRSDFLDRKYTNENATVAFDRGGVRGKPILFFYDLLVKQVIIHQHLDHIDALWQVSQFIDHYTVISIGYCK